MYIHTYVYTFIGMQHSEDRKPNIYTYIYICVYIYIYIYIYLYIYAKSKPFTLDPSWVKLQQL